MKTVRILTFSQSEIHISNLYKYCLMKLCFWGLGYKLNAAKIIRLPHRLNWR